MEWLLLTLKSLPILKYFFEKLEKYVIEPISKWYEEYMRNRIKKKYDDMSSKEEDTSTTIDIERTKPDSEESDEVIRNAHRKKER